MCIVHSGLVTLYLHIDTPVLSKVVTPLQKKNVFTEYLDKLFYLTYNILAGYKDYICVGCDHRLDRVHPIHI